MRIQRFATMALSVGTAAAFAPPTLRNTGSQMVVHSLSIRFPVASSWMKSTTTTAMPMIFERFFGGGAYSLGMDYSKLEHPGPELARWAKEGKIGTVSEKDPNLRIATFAGGCFWGMELAYQRVPGVVYTAVGYSQGVEEEPNYDQVCSGATGHTEAVVVYYDPQKCSYEQLLDAFFGRVNPTTKNGQGKDYGRQYRTGVYTHSEEQLKSAQKRFEEEQKKYSRPIQTELRPAKSFWPAEDYHQQYLEKGGRFGRAQDATKGSTEEIRCYG